MAKFVTFDDKLQKVMDDWVAARPQVIQDMVKSHPMNALYLRKSNGKKVNIVSYEEDGTVTVFSDPRWNPGVFAPLTMGMNVFGVPLSDLVETDLPEGVVVEHRRYDDQDPDDLT